MIDPIPNGARITAPMTLSTAAALLASGRALLRGEGADSAKPFAFDLSAVDEADSSALTLLLAFLRTARETGHTLEFRHPPAELSALADLYGLTPLLPFSRAA